MNKQAPNIIVFGGTGDLAKKYLWPALSSLVNKGELIEPIITGVAHRDRSLEEFKDIVNQSSAETDWWGSINYLNGELDQPEVFSDLKTHLLTNPSKIIMVVLAVAPEYFMSIAKGIEDSGILSHCRSTGHELRIMIEKPFGVNLQSAKKLDLEFCSRFESGEIYRIDHYQGKSMLQNLYSLRFANGWFASGWNNSNINRVEAKFLETVDASDRGSFYDNIGAWRDVGQNHLLQLLAAGMMNQPESDELELFHNCRAEFLESLEVDNDNAWQKGQYASYPATKGVGPESETETYFKISLKSNLERWSGVTVSLQAGKATGQHETSLDLLTCPRHFGAELGETSLKFVTTPHESASLELWGQDDSHRDTLEKHVFNFSYQSPKTDAYERVFYSALMGNQRWFTTSREIMAQWRIADAVAEKLKTLELEIYPDNTLLE